jgi:hypothetical protein
MSDIRPAHDGAGLDAYLDGQLDAVERDRFEQRLRLDPILQAELVLQRRLDEALRRRFEPPSPQRVLEALSRRAGGPQVLRFPSARRWFQRPWGLAVAASIIVALIGVNWYVWTSLPHGLAPRPERRPIELVSLERGYQRELERGFRPLWLCETDHEFASAIFKSLGQGLLITIPPAEIKAKGLSYLPALSKDTMILLAEVETQPVVVFIDRLAADSRPTLPPESGLRLFRREVGALVLYEVTPLGEPRVLELFYDPKMPEEWYRADQPPHDKQPTTRPKWER